MVRTAALVWQEDRVSKQAEIRLIRMVFRGLINNLYVVLLVCVVCIRFIMGFMMARVLYHFDGLRPLGLTIVANLYVIIYSLCKSV